jgi:hypothetical protein
MKRLFVTLLVLLFASACARAIDPETSLPYRWRVIVQFQPSPLFTPAFRKQLLDDTRAALQPAIGAVGIVEVQDIQVMPMRDELTKAFLETGWPALDLPKFRELTGLKTHFVRLSATGGTLRVEARQHDGSSGLALPVVRSKETRDPQTLNRLVGLVLGNDFGPVATVEVPEKESEYVKVRFRGGSLAGFDRQVKVGDILIVGEIFEQKRPDNPNLNSRTTRNEPTSPPLLIGKPREYTLLRIESLGTAGQASCRVLTRFQNAFSITRTRVGVRAMKISTMESPVQLRIVDQAGVTPAAGTLLQVRASDIDFLPTAAARDRLELRDGVFRSGRPLRNVACVVVTLGSAKEERFPVPIMDGKPMSLKFVVDAKMAARVDYETRLMAFMNRVIALSETQLTLVKDLARLIINGKNGPALERAVEGLANLSEQDKFVTAEQAELKKAAEANDPDFAARLAAADKQLQALREGRPGIESKVEDLRKTLDRATDTANFEKEFAAKEITLAIRRLIEAGEIPEALEEFDRLYNLTKQEATKEQKAKIETEWKPRNDAHKKARDFVINTWRQQSTLEEFTRNLEKLQDAHKTLIDNEDRLGLRNFVTAMDQTYAKFKDILERLDPNTESDKPALLELRTLSEELRKLEDAAKAKIRTIEAVK